MLCSKDVSPEVSIVLTLRATILFCHWSTLTWSPAFAEMTPRVLSRDHTFHPGMQQVLSQRMNGMCASLHLSPSFCGPRFRMLDEEGIKLHCYLMAPCFACVETGFMLGHRLLALWDLIHTMLKLNSESSTWPNHLHLHSVINSIFQCLLF